MRAAFPSRGPGGDMEPMSRHNHKCMAARNLGGPPDGRIPRRGRSCCSRGWGGAPGRGHPWPPQGTGLSGWQGFQGDRVCCETCGSHTPGPFLMSQGLFPRTTVKRGPQWAASMLVERFLCWARGEGAGRSQAPGGLGAAPPSWEGPGDRRGLAHDARGCPGEAGGWGCARGAGGVPWPP